MSSLQNISLENEGKNNPDQESSKEEQHVPVPSENDASPYRPILHDDFSLETRENIISTSNSDLINISKSTVSEESINDSIQLQYEDDNLDEDEEILDENVLLNDIELEDELIVQEDEKNIVLQNQDVTLEKVGKNIIEDSIHQQINLDENKIESENQSIITSVQNILNNDENKKLEGIIVDDNKEVCINASDDKDTSFSEDFSFDRITEHGLNKPDMMLEIPSQELIEFSDDGDEELELDSRLKMLPSTKEVIDLDGVNADNLEKIAHTDDSSSADFDITIISGPENNTDVSQAIVDGCESFEDVNMEVTANVQDDITTNVLSYEAEIAADIITKEMNSMDNETTLIKDTEPVSFRDENEIEMEELASPLESNFDKEITSLITLDESSDIIDLSDDNTEVQPEYIRPPLALTSNVQNTRIENAMKLSKLEEEDMLKDIEEIDNLILSNNVCKTKITQDEAKASDVFDNITKSTRSNIEQNRNSPVLGTKMTTTCNQNIKILTERSKTVAMETDEMTAPKTIVATETDEMTATKTGDSTADNLTKMPSLAQDKTAEITKLGVTTDNSQTSVPDVNAYEVTSSQPPQLDTQSVSKNDSKFSEEVLSQPNIADLLLPSHSEIDAELISTSAYDPQILQKPQEIKCTTEPKVSMIEDPEMSPSHTVAVKSVINELKLTQSGIKTDSEKCLIPELTEKHAPSEPLIKILEEPMEIEQQSMLRIGLNIPEIVEPQPSTSNSEPKMLEIVEPELSISKLEPKIPEIIKPLPSTSKIEPIVLEITVPQQTFISTCKIETETPDLIEPQPSTSKIETTTSDIIEPQPSTSKIETKTSDIVEPQPSTSKIDTKTSDIVEPQASILNIETKTSDIVDDSQLPTSKIEIKTSDIIEPQSSLSKIVTKTSNIIEPQPSTSKTETKTSNIVDPQPPTSKIETTTPDIIEPQPSTSKIESKTSDIIEPQPSTSKIETKTPAIVEPQPSTSKIETKTSDIVETQPATIEIETERLKPKLSTSKCGSETFDSLVKDSSNHVPEMSDSLGLLAESSRMMEDEEEHDDDDYGEEEDDFEPDYESSNQVMAEHFEDSSAHHSESEVQKDPDTPDAENQEINFEIIEVTTIINENEPEIMEFDEEILEDDSVETLEAGTDGGLDITSANETVTMEDDTVRLSDASDTEDTEVTNGESVLESLLLKETPTVSAVSKYETWARKKKLSISKQESVVNFVDLEESSSDEDKNQPETREVTVVTQKSPPDLDADIASDVPSGEAADVVEETEIISNKKSSKASPKVVARPKSVVESKSPSKAVSPASHASETKTRSPIGLEVFNLDSDEEDMIVKQNNDKAAVAEDEPIEQPKIRKKMKCINRSCTNNDPSVPYYVADARVVKYFETDKKNHANVCAKCADVVEKLNKELINGIKTFVPLFQLHTTKNSEDLVEIFDSDSDEEAEPDPMQVQLVGKEGADMLKEKLADMLNETWEKYHMDQRIAESRNEFQIEIERLKKESEEINALFNECQQTTDRLRNSLYATFDPKIEELPPVLLNDSPNCSDTSLEKIPEYTNSEAIPTGRRPTKRRISPSKDTIETPLKKFIIPTVASEVCIENSEQITENTELSLVELGAETVPVDLPPLGILCYPALKLGMTVYAMKNAFGTWLRARVVEIQPKAHNTPFTMVRVRFENTVSKNPYKTLPARCIAYFEPSNIRLPIGTRAIALFKDITMRQAYYSGIVAEIPNIGNNYRYLIFFDDGYAQYAMHAQTRLVCEFSSVIWEEVHPYSREFVRNYLLAYPERPMVRLHPGQNLKTERRGKWCSARVMNVDASLVEVEFLRGERREWIYRGSTRLAPLYLELQAAERHRPRALPRTQPQARVNMPYVEYTRPDEQVNKQILAQRQQINEEIRRQRAVAKKSTALAQTQKPLAFSSDIGGDKHISRVVYYTPKNAVKPHKMTPHTCSPACKRTDVLTLKELRTYNPLAKPLLSGWERQFVRGQGRKKVMYVAPCGRRLRNMRELHRYLSTTESETPVDLFDFSTSTHCLAEYVLHKCFVAKKDLSHGKEIVPVPCVNYYDESMPEFCSYNTERTPTAGVPLNLDPEFLCGCDCEDDCLNKKDCACWKMTLEGARTIGIEGDVGYKFRRLPEPLPSGIYECNSRCKCKQTCLNRVAQHPLQLKLQVFQTSNRGWGIRALNDVPKGAFLCIYAGNLLTDATANLDGLNEGDEYLAELDYIEVVEQMKEGYEEDIPDKCKSNPNEEEENEEESSEEETNTNKNEEDDGDFEPGSNIGLGVAEFSKRLRRRDSKKDEDAKPEDEGKDAKQNEGDKDSKADEEFITISDDEVREPSCFTAAAGMGKNKFISKYRSVRKLFGEDEACYIMDAKVQGNIGRYLNHSCTPNVFVQNVFVDTHDPRFPWVAFFALHHIRAGTELTWNYNYDVGSVPGKVMYCRCGAPNCRGRLL